MTEFGHGLRYSPGTLAVIVAYLLLWSDHEAWPIGLLTFLQTISGQDPEIFQHKLYRVFSSTAAVSKILRRNGWSRNPIGAAPLFILGIGTTAANAMVVWASDLSNQAVKKWELAWGVL